MKQPPKKNIDATKEIIELDDDSMEQVTGTGLSLSNIHPPGLYEKSVRTVLTVGVGTQKYPVYTNRLTGNEHIQYPDGTRRYMS